MLKIKKKFERIFLQHAIRKNLDSILIMLENGLSFKQLSRILNLNIDSLETMLSLIYGNKHKVLKTDFEYIHLKLMLLYQKQRQKSYLNLIKNFGYSTMLIFISTSMLFLYLFYLSPILKGIAYDFGLDGPIMILQGRLAYTLVGVVFVFLMVSLLVIIVYRIFPVVFQIVLIKKSSIVRMYHTYCFVELFQVAYAFYSDFYASTNAMRSIVGERFITRLIVYMQNHVKDGSLIYQNHMENMVDVTLTYLNEGVDAIDVLQSSSIYLKITHTKLLNAFKRYGSILKLVAILMVALVIYIFYSSLMIPLNVMEVL